MIGRHTGLPQDNREPKPCSEVQLHLPLYNTGNDVLDELLDSEYQQWLSDIQETI